MAGFTFRPARREGTHLLVGLIGGSGSGKSCSALRLATGLAGTRRFAAIDTEAGRLLHFADDYQFDYAGLGPPFTPEAYRGAIEAAAKDYPVIVVDSLSHEHAGEGGLLDWHDRVLDEMVARKLKRSPDADQWELRKQMGIAAWIEPKKAHKELVQWLLQLRAHLVLCFRAEQKIKITKDGKGKTQIIDAGWLPICAKGLEFELTASFLLSHESPGLPNTPLKPLPPSLRGMFPPGAHIDEATGRRLAAWAAGGERAGGDASAAETPAPSEEVAAPLVAAIVAAADRDHLVELYRREAAAWGRLADADQAAVRKVLGDRARALGFQGVRGLADAARLSGAGSS